MVQRMPNGDLAITWDVSCLAGDTDYIVYEGTLGDFTSHVPVSCSTAGSPSLMFTPSSLSTYYLIVPHNEIHEGSLGRQSDASERPQGPVTCLSQSTGRCL